MARSDGPALRRAAARATQAESQTVNVAPRPGSEVSSNSMLGVSAARKGHRGAAQPDVLAARRIADSEPLGIVRAYSGSSYRSC